MKTDVFKFTRESLNLENILNESEKISKFAGMNKKQTIRLRLLSEELVGILNELLDCCSAEFWVESNGLNFELHLSIDADDFNSIEREKIMSLSSTGENSAAKGIMSKIRIAAETMLFNYQNSVRNMHYEFYEQGVTSSMTYYGSEWTLAKYKREINNRNKEEWDELEKSIIANIADDVVVGIIGKKVDIVVKKNFDN